MSLYRKWRPLGFSDLVGQEAVVRTLSHALESGKLVHAYLFSGPRGSGKTSAAKIMARAVTCVHGPTATPDNTCENCLAILAGTALDVVEIDAASNRGIDEIRALRDAVKFAPATMRKKVYIVDEAHMLTKEGANAFLKTLEEPPPHVVFILATTAPEALPVTILSRCQRYAFRRIPTGIMVERMRMIAEAEGISADLDALRAIAQRADGGLRDALTMLEQAASFADGAVDTAVIDAAFGAGGRAFANVLIDGFVGNDASAVLGAIDEASAAGVDMANFIRHIIAELRCVLLVRVDADLLSGELLDDELALARDRAERLPQVRLLRALRLLADALSQSRQSGNPRLELESAMLRLTLQGEDPSLEALAARVKMLEEQLAGGAVPMPAPAARPAAAKKPPATAHASAAPEAMVAGVGETGPAAAVSAAPASSDSSPVMQASSPETSAPAPAPAAPAKRKTAAAKSAATPAPTSALPAASVPAAPPAAAPPAASAAAVPPAAIAPAISPTTNATAVAAPAIAAPVKPEPDGTKSASVKPSAVKPEFADRDFAANSDDTNAPADVRGSTDLLASPARASDTKRAVAADGEDDDSWPDAPPDDDAPAAYATPVPAIAADPSRVFDRLPQEAAALAEAQEEATAAAAAGEEPTLARLRSLWPNVRARAEGKIPSLRGPLSRTSPGDVSGWTVTLQVADTQNAELLRNRLTTIEGALSDVLGGSCRAVVSVASGTPLRGAKKVVDDPAEASLGLLDYAAKRLGVAGD